MLGGIIIEIELYAYADVLVTFEKKNTLSQFIISKYLIVRILGPIGEQLTLFEQQRACIHNMVTFSYMTLNLF